ncbi:MAG: hypothetical protein AB4062_08025 [Crocosphaera sp.]
MSNNNSYQPFQPNSTEAIKSDLLTHSSQNESQNPPEVMDVTILSAHDPSRDQDWFDLARKLRGQNRELLDTIVKLEQALATSRQQIQDYQQRSLHHNSLVSQQTTQLQSTQAQNSSLIEQLQQSQHQEKQQKQQLQVLQEKLNILQQTVADLEKEYAVLQEENGDKNEKITLQEEQIRELQQRLQRQQRYSLQYKAALDECLNSSAKTTPTQKSTENDTVKLNPPSPIVAIQPWSSPTPSNPSQSSGEQEKGKVASDSIDQTLEELFSLSPVEDNAVICEPQDSSPEETEPPQDAHLEDPSSNSANALLVSSSVPFSFSIDRHRKEDAAREKVDLPSFLRRQ